MRVHTLHVDIMCIIALTGFYNRYTMTTVCLDDFHYNILRAFCPLPNLYTYIGAMVLYITIIFSLYVYYTATTIIYNACVNIVYILHFYILYMFTYSE